MLRMPCVCTDTDRIVIHVAGGMLKWNRINWQEI